MLTGVPSLTTWSAAGIWLEIFFAGSSGCGEAWPSVSLRRRSTCSASLAVLPTMFGTVACPLPTATWSVTSEPFSAFSPAAGTCPITVPGSASLVTFGLVCAAALRPLSTSTFSASNVDLAPTTSGTVTFLGSSR